MTTKGKLVAAAVAGMFVAAPAMARAADTKGSVKCEGVNACKGKGGCKSAHNDCAGKNGCKGKGWTMTSEKECKEKKGTIMADAK